MSKRKKISHRLLMVVLTGALVLVLDFGLRTVYLALWKKKSGPVVAHRTANPDYHHGLKANMSVTDRIGGYEYPFFSNSLGMRDREVREIPQKKQGARILLIGDSFTEGVGLPWEKTFVGIVQAALAPQGVEVLNAGVNSFCPLLMKHRLQDLIEKRGLEVDRVVVLIDISDTLQELQYRETPDGPVEAIPYAPFEQDRVALDRANQIQDWLGKNIENRFVLLGALARNLQIWWRSHDDAIRRWDGMGEWAWNWPDSQGPFRPLVDRGLRLSATHMEEIASLLQTRNIQLTIVVYPWPQQLGSSHSTGEAERFWSEWAQRHGADFISLYPAFRELGEPAQVRAKYYFRGDCHWNAAGHAVVAQSMLGAFRPLILPMKKSAQGP